MSENTATVEQEAVVTVTAIGTKKKVNTGNVILDIAKEVEGLSKQKALNEADKLAENVEVSYFRLGGVLKLINDNSWFEGFASFDDFVLQKYGFAGRKARYLISIYDNLVTKQISWEKVQHLGWTKLKELAPVLTPENTDEWVSKAEALTYVELMKLLKPSEEGTSDSIKPTDEIVKINFKLKADQAEAVNQALAKARGELHTEFDTVALENICLGYLGGNTSVAKVSFEDQVKSLGFEVALTKIAELYPEFDINVTPVSK